MANFNMTSGVDNFTGGATDDTFTFTSAATANSGDAIDGAGGTDAVVIGSSLLMDLREISIGFTSIEALVLGANSTILFSSNQLLGGAGQLPTTLSVSGAVGNEEIRVFLPLAGGSVSLAGWTFLAWTNSDAIRVFGSGGADTITGSSQGDIITGSFNDDILTGGGGGDFLYGEAHNDTLNGDTGDDQLIAGILAGGVFDDAGNDALNGGADNDIIYSHGGVDTIDGGTETDTVVFDRALFGPALTFTALAGGVATVVGDGSTIANIENFEFNGGFGNDTITTLDGFDILSGGFGQDTLNGGGGGDIIIGGIRLPSGAAGTDTENDTLNGNEGPDFIVSMGGVDSIDGGTSGMDIDTVRINRASTSAALAFTAPSSGSATVVGDGTTIANAEQYQFFTGAGSDTITLLAGDDFISAGGGDDMLRGGAGSDTIDGGTHSTAGDTADYSDATGTGVTVDLSITFAQDVGGGLGSDTLTAIENLSGSALADNFTGDINANILSGLGGNDILRGGLGDDTLDGGFGIDTANLAEATTNVNLTLDAAGNAVVTATGLGTDTLIGIENAIGGTGNDIMVGNDQANVLDGGAGTGADNIDGRGGNDTLIGGAGTNDTATFSTTTLGVVVDLTLAADQAVGAESGTDQLSGFENIAGGAGDDTLRASAAANILTGNAGDDLLQGRAGNDTINGGTHGIGGDTADYSDATGTGVTVSLAITTAQAVGGGLGSDTITNVENLIGSALADTLTGDAGDNRLRGGAGDDTLDGGANGVAGDTADYADATGTGVTVNLAITTAQAVGGGLGSDTLNNIENLIGSALADTLTGNALDNRLRGGGGDDLLVGGAHGAAGDAADYADATAGVAITLAEAGDTIVTVGGLGTDTLREIESLIGGLGADLLIGNSAANTLAGGAGSDTLNGNGGADTLQGGAGTDFLFFDAPDTLDAGADYDYAFAQGAAGVTVNLVTSNLESVQGNVGNDVLNAAGAAYDVVLNGGGGADQLTGGAGNDTFNFDAADTAVLGGTGTDFAWAVTETADLTVNMLTQNLEIVWGGAGNDTITAAGRGVAIQIDGKDGNDIITGGNANNILIGNGGADQITGGVAGDQIYFDASDTVVIGGSGFDFAYAHNTLGVSVNLQTQGLEAVYGSFFADNLDASARTTTVYLLGNSGADQLRGGTAGDQIYFDHEDTVVLGGAGYDFAYAYNVGFTAVTVNLFAQGLEEVWGGFGADVLDATGITTAQVVLVGLDGADTLTGGTQNDTLSAGNGNDLLKGGLGNDTIFGEGGTGDISIYDGLAGDYSWTMIGANVYTVTHTASGAVDTIFNVEFLRFLGGGADVPL